MATPAGPGASEDPAPANGSHEEASKEAEERNVLDVERRSMETGLPYAVAVEPEDTLKHFGEDKEEINEVNELKDSRNGEQFLEDSPAASTVPVINFDVGSEKERITTRSVHAKDGREFWSDIAENRISRTNALENERPISEADQFSGFKNIEVPKRGGIQESKDSAELDSGPGNDSSDAGCEGIAHPSNLKHGETNASSATRQCRANDIGVQNADYEEQDRDVSVRNQNVPLVARDVKTTGKYDKDQEASVSSQDVPVGDKPAEPTEDGSVEEGTPHQLRNTAVQSQLEGITNTTSSKRIEIFLVESPRLTFVASEKSGDLTSASLELEPGSTLDHGSGDTIIRESSAGNAGDLGVEDADSGIARRGESVGHSRDAPGKTNSWRRSQQGVERREEAPLLESEEVLQNKLKSKSFLSDISTARSSSLKKTERKETKILEDGQSQYMSLPQDDNPDAEASPPATNPTAEKDSSNLASPSEPLQRSVSGNEESKGKVRTMHSKEVSGGLTHSKSLDVSALQRASSPSLRPTLSYDGSGFFLPTQQDKVLQNSLMPEASQELMQLIDAASEGSDQALDKLRRVVSDEKSLGQPNEVMAEFVKSARLVVDILIAKMGGVDGLDEKMETTGPRMMLRASAAIVASELLPWLPVEGDRGTSMSPRTRMAKALALALRACTRNRAMCSAAGLLRTLLLAAQVILNQEAEETQRWDTSPLFDAFEALGSHCLTVLDLREWLRTAAKSFVTGKSLDLILTLERTMSGEETRGPSHSFEFDGESSGLLGPGESRWPFGNGYAFATWLYLESFADTVSTAAAAAAIAAAASAKSAKTSAMSAAAAASALAGEGTAQMPRVFSFLSRDNLGVEAYFHGQFLVVDCLTGKGKKSSLHFTHPFQLRRWYFIGLEHICKQGLLGKTESEMKLYIDGRLYESRPLVFPRPSSLNFCCIGTNPPPSIAGLQRRRLQCPLFAEMGPIYIFKEPIGQEKMNSLAVRGGDALSSFGAGAGVPWFANNEQAMSAAEDSAALDLEIGPQLHLLYHPKLLMGRSCPDASPAGASGLHKKPAEVLGHVHVAARIRPTETIWAMAEGGPMALLPLTVGAVDKNTLQPVVENAEVSASAALLSAPIFRMLSLTLQHPGNAEEIARSYAPRLLAHLLGHLVCVPSVEDSEIKAFEHRRTEERDEELVVAVVALAQAPKDHVALKVQLYSSLLLDLKLWSSCSYGLQKKLLSMLADMVFTESETMRGANAVQMLLDGCRRCYWLIPEPDSIDVFAGGRSSRPAGELNALVDELLVVVELLVGTSAYEPSLYTDVCSLVQFVLDCPQPNQVARLLHLIYRLVVQPNTSKAAVFAETLLACGGVEMLLTLLRREVELGERATLLPSSDRDATGGSEYQNAQNGVIDKTGSDGIIQNSDDEKGIDDDSTSLKSTGKMNYLTTSKFLDVSGLLEQDHRQWPLPIQEVVSVARSSAQRGANLGGISLSISADRARNKFRNVDSGDGIMVGIVSLLGALIGKGHLKAMSSTLAASQPMPNMTANPVLGEGFPGASATAVVWLLYAMQQAFQAAPNRLMTVNVYAALLPAVIRSEITKVGTLSSEDRLALYDCGHRFEHTQLLLILLHSLQFAPRQLQLRALQDLLLLACTHPENRTILTTMSEWPEWLLEILLSYYEADGRAGGDDSGSSEEIEDLVYSFLAIMLEHSMRLKDGWKDVEATLHCAEWLTLVRGSSQREQRLLREASLPVIKRKILGSLVDFAASELHFQTQIVAAAAAGVAAEGLSPRTARVEAEAAASLSMSLAENALVLLMLVEDHLRLESQFYYSTISSKQANGSTPITPTLSAVPSRRHSAIGIEKSGPALDISASRRLSSMQDTGSLSLEVLATMADENGQISASAMERLTASAAAEPFDSVRCAFACYGTSGLELAASWKRRSRMWYGVGHPLKCASLGGGGRGFEAWASTVERDAIGQWVELPLLRKSITMLQALLLDASGPGGGGGSMQGFGGGAGTGAGGAQLQQLLDSDQPFFAMLRMVLVALREEDRGEDSQVETNRLSKISSLEVSPNPQGSTKLSSQKSLGETNNQELATRRAKSSLLWCVLAPLLTMQLFESRRQRVLVAVSIFYSEVCLEQNLQVWHAVSDDRQVIRKQYLETIIPPFAALLRRWRPLLSGIHEFTDADGQSPLAVEDRPLAIDALPLQAALAMITPAWAAAFASPPAAMALAMAAAGVGAVESSHSRFKGDPQPFGSRSSRLLSFSSFHKTPDSPGRPQATTPKDKATAKAVALATARDQERAARVGSGRGLGAVAMATAWQRRTLTDRERARRWNILEAMSNTWQEYDREGGLAAINISDSAHSLFGVLPAMVETARRMRILEVNRRSMAAAADDFGSAVGGRVWRSLVRRLQEMGALFGAITNQIGPLERVFWKIDSTENSLRMRKRLRRNYKATYNHVAIGDHKESQHFDMSAGIPLPAEVAELASVDVGSEETREEDLGSKQDDKEETKKHNLKEEDLGTATEAVGTPGSASKQSTNAGVVLTAASVGSEAKEIMVLEIPAALVQPVKVRGGMFQVTTKRICFMVDDRVHINESGVGVLIEAKDLPKAETERELERRREDGSKDRLWPLSSLQEVHSRRYALRRSALELFMVDRSNCFFNFGTSDARLRAYKAIVQANPPNLDFIYCVTQNPERILKESQLTELWAQREISNFEYLMQLNTLAGRTYNDMTQYPVFPWVLTDYTSRELDLEDSKVYRDLSKPVGALNPTRLEKFLERYESFEDPVIPRFHYGSHYSSAGTALYYLVRVEPYSALSFHLYGGQVDHAKRMFSDIASTWNQVLEDMNDVKELVPELFYLPEVLINDNEIDLGQTEGGEKIGNLKLPPWASSAVDFIQKHRAALESDYVSEHLHEWIDLIFGYKQRGAEAVAARNLFFHMTYEGTLDIDKINDPVVRKATQHQISHFGQTPSQLLTIPHIKRMPTDNALHLQTVFRNPQATKAYAIPFPDRLNVPAAEMRVTYDSIVAVDMEVPACHIAVHKWQANNPDGKGMPFLFQHGRSGLSANSGALMRMFRGPSDGEEESRYPKVVALPPPGARLGKIVTITPDGRYLLTGGHADNSLKVVATESARALENAYGHCAPITCLGLSPDGSTLVTGSRDATAILWNILGSSNVSKTGLPSSMSDPALVVEAAAVAGSLLTSEGGEASASMVDFKLRHVEGPIHVLRGHVDELICCCVNVDLDLVVSSSRSQGVLLHSVIQGRFLRRLPVDRANVVALSPEGIIIVFNKVSRVLQTFTVNGKLVASKLLPSWEGSISSLIISKDGLHAVIGTACGRPLPPDGRWQNKSVPVLDSGRHGSEQPRQWDMVRECPECYDKTGSHTPQCHLGDKMGQREDQSGLRSDSTSNRPPDKQNRMKRSDSTGSSSDQKITIDPQPAIILLDIYSLEVMQKFMLKKGQDITAMALTHDNSNLVVSTADRQLLVFTDPALSLKIMDQGMRLGYDGASIPSKPS